MWYINLKLTQSNDYSLLPFFGTQTLQSIPLVSILIARNKQNLTIIAILYFLFITFALIQAFMGRSQVKF